MGTHLQAAEIAATSSLSTVDIIGDGWEFHGPAWLAWRIRSIASVLTGVAQTSQTAVKSAVQFHAMGGSGKEIAMTMMDDEWRCGNEPRPLPHPHWTEQLLELAEYADSLPANSKLRASALALARGMLDQAGSRSA